MSISFWGTKKDFDHLLENLNKTDPDFDYFIYNLDRNDFDGKNRNWEDYDKETQEKMVRALVQVKLLNGETYLIDTDDVTVPVLRQEYKAFKSFLEDKIKAGLIDPKTLQTNLKKFLTKMRPTIASDFANSAMAKAFKETIRSF